VNNAQVVVIKTFKLFIDVADEVVYVDENFALRHIIETLILNFNWSHFCFQDHNLVLVFRPELVWDIGCMIKMYSKYNLFPSM
jgi:hypothetical protein